MNNKELRGYEDVVVSAVVGRLGLSHADALDVFQDAVAKVWSQPPIDLPFRTRLLVTARSIARDRRRAARRYRNCLARYAARVGGRFAAAPDIELQSAEEQERLSAAVRDLPERLGRVLDAYLQGLTYAQIAEQFGISTAGVKRVLGEVRSRLRSH